MPRVKRGTTHVKKRKALLKQAKGFMWGRKNLIRLAATAVTKAGAHAFKHRRTKKRDFRKLWNIKISAGLFGTDMSYSKFIGALKKKNIGLNRKMLAELAEHNKSIFDQVVETAKK